MYFIWDSNLLVIDICINNNYPKPEKPLLLSEQQFVVYLYIYYFAPGTKLSTFPTVTASKLPQVGSPRGQREVSSNMQLIGGLQTNWH